MRRLLVRGRWRQMYLDVPQSHVSSSSISIDLARVTNPNLLYNRLPFQRESPIYPLSRPHQSPTLLAAWCFVASLNIRSSTHAEFWSRTRPHPAAHFTNHSGWSLHMRANILPSKSFQRRLPKICERAPPGFEASSKLDYSIALGEIAIDQPSSTTVN
ncbi:hypothetical protein AOQ84DRAFT_206642 [Glonium stellatum]|uniref:Uncharacterized protein n=1 Tax=Glonium stellatum TaxID=574774 RepID=A0A8E2FD48_9PEZI|nr:hypothetical protein AOQ84DRAFT_206642 [Glonium stellatum]